jgi:hypothetical protein
MRAWRLSQQKVQGVLGMMYTTWSADYSFLRPFAYYAWGAGPYIVHAPLDSNVIATMKPGDSILVEATIFPDPYDPADSIVTATAQFVGYGPTGLQEAVTLRRVSGNNFAGYAHGNFAPISFSYFILATNAQGLPRVTPTYQYGAHTSGVMAPTAPARPALAVYPNPATGPATVRLTLPAGPWRLRIVDMLGNEAIVLRGELDVAAEKRLPIDIALLPSGAYRCQLVTGSGLTTAGFSVVR